MVSALQVDCIGQATDYIIADCFATSRDKMKKRKNFDLMGRKAKTGALRAAIGSVGQTIKSSRELR